MATAPDIFTKTVTYNDTEPCLRMATRQLLHRLTGLPPNWLIARVGMIASLTTPSGDNLSPVSETLGASGNTHQNWLFGLDDGVGFPHDAGSGHFVGVRVSSGQSINVANYASAWQIGQDTGGVTYLYFRPLWTNGATIGEGGSDLPPLIPKMTDPTAVAAYAFGMVVEMDLRTAGTLSVTMKITQNLSRTDKAQMSALLNDSLTGAQTVTGGWWSGSVNVACQNFFMRWPLSLNSMRVHNYDFVQLA